VTQPLPFPSAWDLIMSLRKASVRACLHGAAGGSHFLCQPWFLVRLFGRSQSSIPALCCYGSLGPFISNSCRALDRRVRYFRRRAGAGFVIYINSQLHASEAHPAGLKSSDFRAESVAMSLGLTALTSLKDSYSYSSIRIFTDCQTLISTLSRGPARQPDSVCTSIWLHLSSISEIFQHLCPVDPCTRWHPWQHAGGLEGQAGLHPSSDIGPY